MTELTIARLKEALRYDKQSGQFFWRKGDSKRKPGDRAGCEHKTLGYWVIGLDGKRYLAQKLAWFYVYGVWQDSLKFINGNGLDTGIKNLRERKSEVRLKEAKICQICSSPFARHRNFSNSQWLSQLFCGSPCSEEHKRRAKIASLRCTQCGGDGPFRTYKTSSGRTSRLPLCKICFNITRKAPRRATHREKSSKNPEWYLFIRMKRNAKQRGVPLPTMTYDEFLTEIGGTCPSTCPILGLPLEFSGTVHNGALATIDRIDSSRGYERGNIAIISWRANALKRDGTADELSRIADWMRSKTLP